MVLQDVLEPFNLIGQNRPCGSLGDDVTILEPQDFGHEQQGFVRVVGDREDRKTPGGEVFAQARQQGVAKIAVQSGEGFIEQQQAGVGDGEGSGQGDALAFAAGKLASVLGEQRMELKELRDLGEHGSAWRDATEGFSEADVFGDVEVGQKWSLLGIVGEGTVLRRRGLEWVPGVRGGVPPAESDGEVWREPREGAQEGAFA